MPRYSSASVGGGRSLIMWIPPIGLIGSKTRSRCLSSHRAPGAAPGFSTPQAGAWECRRTDAHVQAGAATAILSQPNRLAVLPTRGGCDLGITRRGRQLAMGPVSAMR